MLSRNQKISSEEFKNFYSKGKRSFSENFRFSVVFGENNDVSRYAVVVSKKIAKTAVLRQKNRRKVYKILREIYPQFPQVKYGFIFIQKNIADLDEKILYNEILDNLRKIIKKHHG